MMTRVFCVLLLCCAVQARAALVEVLPDDYLIVNGDELGIRQSAVAPHPGVDRLLLVWTQRQFSGSTQLSAAVIDANGPSASGYLVDADDGDHVSVDPAAAFDAQSGLFLVVWSQATGSGGDAFEVYGRFLQSDGLVSGAPFPITSVGVDPDDGRFDAVRPAVAADGTGRFLVVWAADDDVHGYDDGDFEIYYRTVAAGSGALGAVTLQSNFSPLGGSALHPVVAYMPWANGFMLVWEGDGSSDPALHAPQIYAAPVYPGGAPRAAAEPVQVSGLMPAARKNNNAARNPAMAVDRQNQRLGLVWDTTPGPASTARQITGAVIDAAVNVDLFMTVRDLGVEGATATSWVRDPAIAHSRIAGRYVISWRESKDPMTGLGQTLFVREFDEVIGFDALPLEFVNQVGPGITPPELGPPALVGGNFNNGRVFATWASSALGDGVLRLYGQGFDAAAATAAPPTLIPRELGIGLAPNPFNPRTAIQLSLPEAGRARVDIFDVRGRLVRTLVDEELPAGIHQRTWSGLDDSGRRVASGVYLIRLRHPGGQRVVKAALVE